MPNVTATPRGQSNGETITSFADSAETTSRAYAYPTTQNALSVSNLGFSNITVTVNTVSYTVTPGGSQMIVDDFTWFSISSSSGAQHFEAKATQNDPNEPPLPPEKTTFANKVLFTPNLFDKTKITPGGYFNYTTGAWKTDVAYVTTDFIPVTEGKTYTHKASSFVNFYDANKVWKVGIQSSKPFTVPTGQNIAYARVTVYTTDVDTEMVVEGSYFYPTYFPYTEGISLKNLSGPLRGLKWNAMGDSITSGLNTTNIYHSIIANRTGIAVRNYGVSGSRITTAADRSDSMAQRYSSMDDNPDIITIFGGTNDYGNSMPIGVWGDATDTTLYGAMKVLAEGLLTKYLGKRIGFILPLPRVGQTSPASGLKNYINVIKEVCDRYSIPTLDLYTGSGIAPDLDANKTAVMPDGLHPNDAGHLLLSYKIQDFIQRI